MIVVIAWAVAAAIAVVLGAFCAYELRWKAARLRHDVAELDATISQLTVLQHDLQTAAARLSALTSRS